MQTSNLKQVTFGYVQQTYTVQLVIVKTQTSHLQPTVICLQLLYREIPGSLAIAGNFQGCIVLSVFDDLPCPLNETSWIPCAKMAQFN